MSSSAKSSQTEYRPGYEAVVEEIQKLIIEMCLQPGDRLPTEHQLSERLGVGRTMVREAIKMLTAQGRLRTRRGSGIYVNDGAHPFTAATIDMSMTVEPKDVLSLFEFRITQEMQTVRLATERITMREVRALEQAVELHRIGAETGDTAKFDEGDDRFHRGIAAASHNPFLASALSTVLRLQVWAVTIAVGAFPGSLLIASQQHQEILAALKEGDAETAAAVMRTHIETVAREYEHALRRLMQEK